MTKELPSTQISTSSNSPEFEFTKLSDPQPNLLTADQLFSGGFLLPLHNLNISSEPAPPLPSEPPPPPLFPESPRPSSANSKRWRQIFRKTDKKSGLEKDAAGGKDRKKISAGVGISVASTELNINIWPFSRSRSAGISSGRPRTPPASARKVSSAPCSRSNSTGESKSRKPPVSTVTGVYLGRTSPILKLRRGGRRSTAENSSTPKTPTGTKTKVLNLNVPMCIGYRQNSSCSREENSPIDAAVATVVDLEVVTTEGGATIVGGGEEELRRSNLLSIRNLFTKKVY